MSTLTVGSGMMFSRLSSAIAASRDGDVIQVQAGTYLNDSATINTKITIQGVGGMARLESTNLIGNGKGILVTNNDVTLENIEFVGAKVADNNGAGIRYQAGHLTIKDCYFHDNQNGILAAANPTGVIDIVSSEFARNGAGDGQTHGIYINNIAKATITDSYFHDTLIGHHIKSRAAETVVTNNRIVDGDGGTASYNVDLPNGGKALVQGNTIVQSPTSDNPYMIAFGEEGNLHSGSSLTVTGNTMSNELSTGKGVWNASSSAATVSNNAVYNLKTVLSGPGTASSNTVLSSPAEPSTDSPWASSPPTTTNHPPVANSDTARTSQDTAVTIKVLANDTDADGNALSINGIGTAAANGTTKINADGTITYTPKAGFTGTDSFKYTIADGHGGTATAPVSVSVDPASTAPVVRATTIVVDAAGSTAGGVWSHFKVMVDGQVIGQASASSTTMKPYTFKTDVTADQAHKVQVQFDNDAVINGKDRNLIVDKVTINGHAVKATDANVTYDKGALDGKDVVKGQSGLWWNGTLVVNADKTYFPSATAQELDASANHLSYVQANAAAMPQAAGLDVAAEHAQGYHAFDEAALHMDHGAHDTSFMTHHGDL